MLRGLHNVRPLLQTALLLALVGCAQQARVTSSVEWHTYKSQIEQLNDWRASGKIGLRSANHAQSGRFHWQQNGSHTRIVLSGPLGLQATEITSDGLQLTVRQGDDVRHSDISSPAAIMHSTGWDLPLQALPYWLRGLPDPRLPTDTLVLDDQGHFPQQLRQNDWIVHFEDFKEFDGLALPARLKIERDDTSVRIIISQWQTGKQ